MVRGRSALFALVAASLVASPVRAQERNLDVERFRPAPDRSGFLGFPGSATPGPWGWNVSLFTGYSLEPLTLRRRDDGTRLPIVAHRVGADLIAQLGITDRIAAVVDLPVVVWQDTNAAPLGSGGQLAALALRDPFLSVRVRLLGDGSTIEHDDEDEGGLALSVATTLPFGLEHSFAGEGSPQLEGSVIGNVRFLLFSVGATVGYRHRFAEPSLLGVRFANELFFGVAVQGPLVFLENTSVIVELRVDTALDDGGFLGESTAGESDVGVRWAEGDVALTWIVGTGFTGGVGTPRRARALRPRVGAAHPRRGRRRDGRLARAARLRAPARGPRRLRGRRRLRRSGQRRRPRARHRRSLPERSGRPRSGRGRGRMHRPGARRGRGRRPRRRGRVPEEGRGRRRLRGRGRMSRSRRRRRRNARRPGPLPARGGGRGRLRGRGRMPRP
ncbi:MAG: hypothetical protein M5U28_15300 [Sandaracinaceae bacterium]|nr:hypothetical protein [Sandaracinaceae bacterium]